ncbi:zinc finger protein 1-like [Vitis riparia]|uniref:zinc finger protein 1-like n=1 Tax=Vitis riparia TaxID=96939 RepID=UPI00155AFFE3|nr:zinc finger protein 1-like [Vitis riparia]
MPTYQALSGNRSSHSYNKKSLDMENKYVSSSHTSASKGEGLALGTSKQVVQKAHKCRTSKTFPTDQALGGHQTTHRPKPAQSATPKHEALMLSAEEASRSTGPRVLDFDLNELPSMEEE